jgi:hypothetical protein
MMGPSLTGAMLSQQDVTAPRQAAQLVVDRDQAVGPDGGIERSVRRSANVSSAHAHAHLALHLRLRQSVTPPSCGAAPGRIMRFGAFHRQLLPAYLHANLRPNGWMPLLFKHLAISREPLP